jgi:dihydrofolate synthase/folylpolyglutamate synthase
MDTTLEAALFARRAQGMKLGLQAVTEAWHALGRPGDGIPTIHVVGTNGKGSTSVMCATALQGLRRVGHGPIGLFTSPHLHHVSERVRLDGVPCDDAALESAVRRVLACEQEAGPFRDGDVHRVLTFFEILTLAALLVFADHGVSAMVLEAGLGGRLDATRIVPADIVVITRIGLDHQVFLGDTLPEIAAEKAGAIRPGVQVVTTSQAPEVMRTLQASALANGTSIELAAPLAEAPAALRGPHQRENAGLAAHAVLGFLRAVRARRAGREDVASVFTSADEGQVTAAFAGVVWPGRFEIRAWPNGARATTRATVVFDVAHNLQGIETLTRTWTECFPAPPDLILFGCLADKDAEGMWRVLPRAGLRLVVPPPREGAHSFVPRVGEGVRVAGPDDLRVWSALERVAANGGRVLVCGSFFLVAALRARILRGEALAGPEATNRADTLDLSDPVPRAVGKPGA